MSPPTTSVVIPTYYRNDELSTTIESAVEQSYDSVEILVVDDSGEKHAKPVVDEYDARYVPLDSNRGPMGARNRGIELASGKYVHFLDDDDRLEESCIEEKVDVAEQSESVGVAYAGFVLNGERRVLPEKTKRGEVLRHALELSLLPCIPSTMLVHRDTLLDVDLMGIADRNLHNEHGLLIELAKRTEFDFVYDALTERDVDDSSLGRTRSSLRKYQNTFEAYRDLYDEFPPSVERTAKGYVYLKEGQIHVNSNRWSWQAIESFALAAYHIPGLHPVYLGSLLASLGGRPLYRLGLETYSRLFAPEQQHGKPM